MAKPCPDATFPGRVPAASRHLARARCKPTCILCKGTAYVVACHNCAGCGLLLGILCDHCKGSGLMPTLSTPTATTEKTAP